MGLIAILPLVAVNPFTAHDILARRGDGIEPQRLLSGFEIERQPRPRRCRVGDPIQRLVALAWRQLKEK